MGMMSHTHTFAPACARGGLASTTSPSTRHLRLRSLRRVRQICRSNDRVTKDYEFTYGKDLANKSFKSRGVAPPPSGISSDRFGDEFLSESMDDEYLVGWPTTGGRCVLFYCKEMEELARKVAHANSNVELGCIDWDLFADGFPDLFVKNAKMLRNANVCFMASFHSPSVIFEQLSVCYSLPRLFVKSFTLVLPFFPTGTMERVEDEGEVATANSLARMISSIPISKVSATYIPRGILCRRSSGPAVFTPAFIHSTGKR